MDFNAINPAGSVPMLVLDDGAAVTENVAILELIADREPKLGPGGPPTRRICASSTDATTGNART